MSGEQKISYSELLKEAVCVFASLTPPDFADAIDEIDASYAQWGPLLQRTAALRALAQLVEDAADLHEQHATTHLPGHDEAWDMLAAFRAGFTAAASPLPAGGASPASPKEDQDET